MGKVFRRKCVQAFRPPSVQRRPSDDLPYREGLQRLSVQRKPSDDFPYREGLQAVFCIVKAFRRPSLQRRPSDGLPYRECLQTIFHIEKDFRQSSVQRRPSGGLVIRKGLLYIKELQIIVYIQIASVRSSAHGALEMRFLFEIPLLQRRFGKQHHYVPQYIRKTLVNCFFFFF